MKPTPTEFTKLAIENPTELIQWIENGTLTISQLTFAAEALALVTDSSIAVPTLMRLLLSNQPVVREGAVYGLEGHLGYGNVRNILKFVYLLDPASGVSIAAKEALI